MNVFAIEHSRWRYRADFALHGLAVGAMTIGLAWTSPAALRPGIAGGVLGGLAAWSLLEYGLHRFVLHGVRPFSHWHAEHHRRPMALIVTPTVLSAALITLLVFLPMLLIGGRWLAWPVTLGVTAGSLTHGITHHAIHHQRAGNGWLRARKRWHARHHRLPVDAATPSACYGVTSDFWDRVFRTDARG